MPLFLAPEIHSLSLAGFLLMLISIPIFHLTACSRFKTLFYSPKNNAQTKPNTESHPHPGILCVLYCPFCLLGETGITQTFHAHSELPSATVSSVRPFLMPFLRLHSALLVCLINISPRNALFSCIHLLVYYVLPMSENRL